MVSFLTLKKIKIQAQLQNKSRINIAEHIIHCFLITPTHNKSKLSTWPFALGPTWLRLVIDYSINFLWQWEKEQQMLLFLYFHCRSILQQTIITLRYNAIMKNTNLPNQIESTDWTHLIWNCVLKTCNLKFNCYGFDNANVMCVC